MLAGPAQSFHAGQTMSAAQSLNATHDPSLRSWVESANRARNRLSHPESALWRLQADRQRRGLPRGESRSGTRSWTWRHSTSCACCPGRLLTRSLLARNRRSTASWRSGSDAWSTLRGALSALLRVDGRNVQGALVAQAAAELRYPRGSAITPIFMPPSIMQRR